jgi:PKD repeat protein
MNLTVRRTSDRDTAYVELTADASRSEPGTGSITAYEWQNNDVTISTEPSFTFRLDEGRYVVTLRVTNSAVLSHTASVSINVREQQ